MTNLLQVRRHWAIVIYLFYTDHIRRDELREAENFSYAAMLFLLAIFSIIRFSTVAFVSLTYPHGYDCWKSGFFYPVCHGNSINIGLKLSINAASISRVLIF